MQQEIEATFLNVDHQVMRTKLQAAGAVCTQPLHAMKRAVYDYEDLRLDKKAAWVRVRQEADKITMGFKQRQSETSDGMKEIEFTVSDYTAASEFLKAIGLVTKARQETKREVWLLNDCQIMLDEWPWIPPYVEVEAATEQVVRATSELLGLDYASAIFDSADGIYQKYFAVERTEISTVDIVFGPVPDWLENKRLQISA